ncbi:MAG: hypothetical protein ACRC2J_16400 [Microcoleaceae cyanobacterium]
MEKLKLALAITFTLHLFAGTNLSAQFPLKSFFQGFYPTFSSQYDRQVVNYQISKNIPNITTNQVD